MVSLPTPKVEPRILRLFISYSSEDLSLAHAIAKGFGDALPEGFAEVCFDKWFLQAGAEVKKAIESKLEKTDFLIIVYTGVSKQTHSFSGWEVGYFERVRKNDPSRRIVPLFLEDPPSTATEFEGYSLKISRDLLQLSVQEFSARNDVGEDDPICALMGELQEIAGKIREDAGYPRAAGHGSLDAAASVKAMRLGIFSYMKTTVQAVLKPQKQITFKTSGSALHAAEPDLPADATLTPVGGSPMSIFGLTDEEITWEKFLQSTTEAHQESWRDAITSVITSSQADRIDVDNSQIILSSDESKTYRIILTTATKYWDDTREFNIYFVETLHKDENGDENTSLMLKGLEIACRYRFLFLESSSQFSSNSLLAAGEQRLPQIAAKLLQELNLMKKETAAAGLDQPHIWNRFIDDWPLILQIAEAYRSREPIIRQLIGRVLNAKDRKETLSGLRVELSKVVGELEDVTGSQNSQLIDAMAKKLSAMVQA